MDAKTNALIKSLFAEDEKGNTYIRTVQTKNPKGLTNSGTSKAKISALLAKAIVLDGDGKPALRLAVVSGAGKSLQDQKRKAMIANQKAVAERNPPKTDTVEDEDKAEG